ncbi:hypothetical protein [Anaeromicropila populeti]|uniref:Uncharacterized protein n=1 Tax=Anaeromicropila populeti TaxID=37658 RepID=A0A1I6HU12_9FIRM|nr:hypothetical protein [Anaeromicropila populeti]SFR57887.1 hypothetical protein SAMN05661086_00288 [Anaeromicropila populeti]
MKDALSNKFYILQPIKNKQSTAFTQYYKKHFKKKYYNGLYYKFPVRVQAITQYHMDGTVIQLPFTAEELEELEKEYIDKFMKKLWERFDIGSCYIEKDLRGVLKDYYEDKSWFFQYMLFKPCLLKIIEHYNIDLKETKVVIVDSNNKKIEFVLQYLVPELNYLTIVTDREEYFQDAIEIIYHTTGLLVELCQYPVQEPLSSTLVIFLDSGQYKLYSMFPENSFVMDLAFHPIKRDYLANRRKDLVIAYDLEIEFQGEQADKELVMEILTKDCWKINRFINKENSSITPGEMEELFKHYKIRVKTLKVLQKDKSVYIDN